MGKKLRWMAGIEMSNVKTGDVDIEKLNKGKDAADMLPDTALLFENYKKWGVIPADQADGGTATLLKLGAIYDTRDNEPNPMKGIWTELQLLWAPSFIGNGDLVLYEVSIYPPAVFHAGSKSPVFRLPVKLSGKIERHHAVLHVAFRLQHGTRLYPRRLRRFKDNPGSSHATVLPEMVLHLAMLEFRWKFYRGVVWKQNVYLALSTFLDAGMVLDKYDYSLSEAYRAEAEKYFPGYQGKSAHGLWRRTAHCH